MLFTILKTNPQRLHDLVSGTPTWTWGLLAALAIAGVVQLRGRLTSTRQAWRISATLAGLGFAGLVFTFRTSPLLTIAVVTWALIAIAVMFVLSHFSMGVRVAAQAPAAQDADSAPVEGSVVPLTLMMLAFAVRYVAGLELAVNTSALQDVMFVLVTSALSGAISGAFLARARVTAVAIRSVTSAHRATNTLGAAM